MEIADCNLFAMICGRCLADHLAHLFFNSDDVQAKCFGGAEDRHGDGGPQLMIRIKTEIAAIDFIAEANIEIGESTAGKVGIVHKWSYGGYALPKRPDAYFVAR